jgi:hypothetical protein
MFGVAIGPPKVLGLPKPGSSTSTRRTFGAPSGGVGVIISVQSATDWSRVRPRVPPKFGSGIGRTVRSGWNLPTASPSDDLRPRSRPFLSECTRDLAGEPGSACSIASRCSSGNTAMIPAEPGGSASPILSWRPLVELVVGELAHDAAGGGADDHRGKQGRREQADHEADAAAPPETLATGVVAGVQEGDAAVLLVRDEDDALDLDLLRLDELAHAVEVLVCGVDVLVGSYQYVHGAVAHGVSLVPRDLAVVGVRSVVAEPPPDRDPVAVRMGSLSRQRWPACVTCHRGTRGLHAVDRPALSVAAAEAVRGASCRRRRWPSAPLRRDRSRTRASWSSPERRVPVLRTRRRDR